MCYSILYGELRFWSLFSLTSIITRQTQFGNNIILTSSNAGSIPAFPSADVHQLTSYKQITGSTPVLPAKSGRMAKR